MSSFLLCSPFCSQRPEFSTDEQRDRLQKAMFPEDAIGGQSAQDSAAGAAAGRGGAGGGGGAAGGAGGGAGEDEAGGERKE